ncbi:MAG: N-acetylmuramoyl-L-alanine amidase [Hyphomicrobium sp.]|jgi:N-acetylmuramoyl-L-alanine amidase
MRTHLQHKVAGQKPRLVHAIAVGLWGLAQCLGAVQPAHAEPTSVHRKSAAVEANHAEIKAGGRSATFVLRLSAGVRAEIFTLAKPYRVVIDLPDVAFDLPKAAGETPQGLVSGFRYGLLSEGKARVVIDTTGPVLIKRADIRPNGPGKSMELTVELVATSAKTFGGGTGASLATAAPAEADQAAPVKRNRAKPLVLIDAGHGGIDPGAASAGGLSEKTIVLAVAQALSARLKSTGRYDVRMTRTTDVFVPLDERVKLSHQLGADLFVSLHADAIAQKGLAKTVRGATVYTLSEQASDEEARRMAEKENNSDAVAGLQTAKFEEEGMVRNILIDLLKRETANFSADLSNTLVKQLGKSISLSGTPQRSAAFKVLRQADTPSVLVELGYMSHPEDEKLLNSAAWQRRVAAAIGSAIDSYFSKRTAKAR